MNENIFTKFRIPTILGLAIILVGTFAGVVLTLNQQIFISQAAINLAPEKILITNIKSDSVTISWQTTSPAIGYITYGQSSFDEQTALDKRDKSPTPRKTHYVSLNNLSPERTYQFKIISGKLASQDTLSFTTAPENPEQNNFPPVIGTVTENNEALKSGIAYLSIVGMSDQSALIETLGNFIIPISQARDESLRNTFKPQEEMEGKLTIISESGNIATATFNLSSSPVGTLNIGTNITFSKAENSPLPSPSTSSLSYDLNGDNILNASDYATMLTNLGRAPKDKRADLNNDGVVDQIDLKLMQDQIESTSRP